MKFSKTASYAVVLLIYFHKHDGSRASIPSHRAALSTQVPVRFARRILKTLADRGLVRSVRGSDGGYWLARSASQISLLEIVEAADGLIDGGCPLVNDAAPADGAAALDGVGRRLTAVVRADLAGVSLEQLSGRKETEAQCPN
jgi:Rrf2 family protein